MAVACVSDVASLLRVVCSVHDYVHSTADVLGGFVLGLLMAVGVFVRMLWMLPPEISSSDAQMTNPLWTWS